MEAATRQDDPVQALVESAGPLAPATGMLLGRPIAHWREETAREFALPSGLRAGAGHQAEFWHPGIVAKFLWAQALAERAGGAGLVWLVVDTDLRDPLELRVPVLVEGALQARVHRFGARAMAAGTIASARPALAEPAGFDPAPAHDALPSIAQGVEALRTALQANAGAGDAASQAVAALLACLAGTVAAAPIVRTSQLLRGSLGRKLIEIALADPAACRAAFNEAAALVPRVARPLGTHAQDGEELPFWTVDAAGVRQRLHAASLARAVDAGAPVLPRAFLTGAIARAALCDRFVHGTGGRLYEVATGRFFERWVGARLPDFDTASATLRLPLPAPTGEPPVTAAQVRARWFDPESLHAAAAVHGATGATGAAGMTNATADSAGPSDAKRARLEAIATLPRRSAQRRAAYRAMMEAQERARAADAAAFEALAARERADRARANERALRLDRTWAAPLHAPEALRTLAASVRRHAS